MDEIDVYEKMSAIAETPQFSMIFGTENEQSRLIAEHKNWLKEIKRPLWKEKSRKFPEPRYSRPDGRTSSACLMTSTSSPCRSTSLMGTRYTPSKKTTPRAEKTKMKWRDGQYRRH